MRRLTTRRLTSGLILLILVLALAGCGNSAGKSQQQTAATNQAAGSTQQNSKSVYLTPVPKGTSLGSTNTEVSKQIMAQKDVTGTQIYEQQGIVYGSITFKSGADKKYAHDLANDLLIQLKVNYPNRPVTTQVVVDGKTTDSISFKP